MAEYLARLKTLQSALSASQLYILSRPADIQYYTGFFCLNPEEREAFFVVSREEATLLYPSFSPIKKMEGIEYHLGYWPSDLQSVVKKMVKNTGATECLVDKASLFVNEYEAVNELKLEIKELERDIIWKQRVVKDAEELAALKKAGEITVQVMNSVLGSLKAGVTEQELAQQIEIEVRKAGAQGTSFPSVVAFGAHAALPHHQPTDTPLEPETVVLIDMGAKYNFYCGDMTRTVWFGKKPSNKFQKVESIVKKAYEAALKETAAQVSGASVDLAARTVIQDSGYGQTFIHTTGHGVGLEIHEQPSLYFKKDFELPEGAVITIEPGIYLEGEFGYRYENMVLVNSSGGAELTK